MYSKQLCIRVAASLSAAYALKIIDGNKRSLPFLFRNLKNAFLTLFFVSTFIIFSIIKNVGHKSCTMNIDGLRDCEQFCLMGIMSILFLLA
jgi:hypothetical protein